MATATFEAVAPMLFAHEGGYSGDRNDPGNWSGGEVGVGSLIGTNHGISAPTLAAVRGRKVTADDMRRLTRDEAVEIYKAQYWHSIKGDALPPGVDYAVFDYCVNSGPARAAKDLQRVVGARADGVVGQMTLDRVWNCGKSPGQIVEELCDRRLAFMKSLRAWRHYGKGWSRRVSEVRTKALAFAANAPMRHNPHYGEQVPTPKAKPEDISGIEAWKTPEGVSTGLGGLSGLIGLISGSEPLQYAAAVILVGAFGIAAWYFVRRMRREA